MKKLLLTLLFFCLGFGIKAQVVEIYADANLGLPAAISLRNFHEGLREQLPYDNFDTTDNFYYNYGFTTGLRFNGNTSIFFSQLVSGAKSSSSDYSGFVRVTNELVGSTIGLKYDLFLKEIKKGVLLWNVKLLATNSILKLRTESEILNLTEGGGTDFKAWDFGIGAGITYEYPVAFFMLRVHLDLDLYLGGKFSLRDGSGPDGAFLQTDTGAKVTSGWTGLNAGIGILIPLSKQRE